MSKNSVKDVEDLNLMPDMAKKDGKAGANNAQKNRPQQTSNKDQRNKQGEHGNKPHGSNITPMPVNNNIQNRNKDNNSKPAPEASAKPKEVAAVQDKEVSSAPSEEKVLKSNSDSMRVVDNILLEMRTGWTDESADYIKAINIKISALEEEIEELKVEKKRVEELISTQKILKGGKNG